MNNNQFVRTYIWAKQNGKTSVDIARKFDVETKRVYGRANYLRKKGVKLPFLNKDSGRRSLDVDGLNRYIAERMQDGVAR